jgi:cytochrome b561
MSRSKKFYYTVARSLHWVAAFIIAFNLMSGWIISDFPLEQKLWIIMVHSGIGVTIFLLMLFRWWWRKSHHLYEPPGFWKRPAAVLMWIFYPLLLIQTVIGMLQAVFIDYDVRAFGFINFSAIAEANESLRNLFLDLHGMTAILLIVLVLIHGVDRSRKAFADDGQQMSGQPSAKVTVDADTGA